MTENEADWAEVLILTASPMITPQPTTLPLACVCIQPPTWFMEAFRSALRFDFLAVALLHETDTYRGGGVEGGRRRRRVGGFTQISLAFYLSFKSFQAWWDSSAVGVRQTRLQTHGGGGPSPPGDLFVYCGPNNLWCCLPCYNVLQCLLAPYLIKLELLDVPLSLQPHWLRLARTLQSDCHPLSRTSVTWRQENVAASLQRWRVCLGLVSICLCI